VRHHLATAVNTINIDHPSRAPGSGAAFSTGMEDDGADFFNRQSMAGPGEVITPPDDEARYEEGIPLVQSEAQLEWPTPTSESGTPSPREAGKKAPPETDDNAVDSEITNTDRTPFRPEHLDRKTTEQVLSSLDFSSHRERRRPSEEYESESKESVSVAADTNHGVVLNHTEGDKGTDRVQVLHDGKPSEEQQEKQDVNTEMGLFDAYPTAGASDKSLDAPRQESPLEAPTSLETAKSDTTQEDAPSDDLVAKWKAALDDDDFLVDGELLPEPNFFEDDGQGFLDEKQTASQQETKSEGYSPSPSQYGSFPRQPHQDSNSLNSSYAHTNGYQQMVPNRYMPNASGLSNSSSPESATSDFARQSRYTTHPLTQAQQGRPSLPAKTQSFADQAKGGYTSPYDMPFDISRPKKRTHLQQTSWGSTAHNNSVPTPPIPPPRSSSMYTSQPPRVAQTQASAFTSNHVTANSPQPPLSVGSSSARTGASSETSKSPSNSFFEELPINTKPRPQSAIGRVLPQQPSIRPSPLQAPSFADQNSSYSPPPATVQLQAPERVNPYAIPPQSALGAASIPATSRYSSAPPTQPNASQSRTRYATPPASGPPPPRVLPFQPRTSSPLAHHQSSYEGQRQIPTSAPDLQRASNEIFASSNAGPNTVPHEADHLDAASQRTEGYLPNGAVLANSFEDTTHESSNGPHDHSVLDQGISDTPPSQPPPPAAISPSKRTTSAYAPQTHSYQPLKDPVFAAPRRSQTQSPGKLLSGSRLPTIPQEPYQRPASVQGPTSNLHQSTAYDTSAALQSGRQRSMSQTQNFISPIGGLETDPLQRWKGCPVFVFGFGGTVVSSFPKHIPRYSAGNQAPMIKCSPGEVRLRTTNNVLPLEDHVAKFPGPLRSKSKKKDILTWLDDRIVTLNSELAFVGPATTLPDPRKRLEEKVLLLKVLRALVEHDGVLEGNSNVEKLTRTILSPEVAGDGSNREADASYVTGADLVGISKPNGSSVQSDPVNHEFVESLRKLLVNGEREKAVWHAVDKRLWAHAMLISSTLSKDVWKQVAQEFVRQEVKTVGNNTESLAALYEVFAGNWEESIDELVPPSARAGLQMVSKIPNSGPTKNALDGLDRWRETLCLILSNRSTGDPQAILALGRLLSGYGRIEAAHICYLFARSSIIFGGPDNPHAHITLLGADLVQQRSGDAPDVDAILLSEVYEYCISVSPSSSTSSAVPHLQGYKLYHAMKLAEYGYRAEAQQYCDAIANSLKTTTKLAPYYHSLLFSALDDVTKRLQQSPKDGSSSWKPSMDKVSGSVWAKFNSFVAGEDSDARSTGSGRQAESDVGPFAKVAGGTPTISRSPSNTDLYSSYPGGHSGLQSVAGTSSNRYAPVGPYAPRTPLEQPGRSSYESQRPSPYEPAQSQGSDYGAPYQPHVSLPNNHTPQYHPLEHWQRSGASPALTDSLEPAEHSSAQASIPLKPLPSPYQQDTLRLTPSSLHTNPFEGYNASQSATQPNVGPVYPASNFNSAAYEPVPSSGHDSQAEDVYGNTYEPPSYEPLYNTEASPTLEKPKKRFTMDDDDDDEFTKKATDVKNGKAQKDRETDEAFKKAAAEDGKHLSPHNDNSIDVPTNPTAKKDANPGDKKGWFGGWFGKKDPNLAAPGPIKAKLGDANSFYYDPDLKRWVNKKGGTDTSAPTAKPPPPRAAPIRAVSSPPVARNPIPAGARPPAPASVSNLSAAASTSMPFVAALPPSGPPSGTGTPLRTDSPGEPGSMLVPPSLAAIASGAGPGPHSSGPPSRPTTALSNASSIDDLIGAPAARKGGTVKRNKKGRGYVDIMAK